MRRRRLPYIQFWGVMYDFLGGSEASPVMRVVVFLSKQLGPRAQVLTANKAIRLPPCTLPSGTGDGLTSTAGRR